MTDGGCGSVGGGSDNCYDSNTSDRDGSPIVMVVLVLVITKSW